jgi:multidrug efflux pump subunit AcrA (membrane-fusion protein)
MGHRSLSFLTAFLLLFCSLGCDRRKAGSISDQSKEVSQQPAYYTCPMHPQVRSEEQGRCPICNMTLVRVEKSPDDAQVSENGSSKPRDAAAAVARVKLSAAQADHFRPALFPVSPMKMQRSIRLLGTVIESEEKSRNIPARIGGRVEKVHVKSTGSYIREGDPVLDLYSPQLMTGGEEYLLARKSYEQNPAAFRELFNQSRERLKLWGVQEYQLERWYKDGKIPRSITIYSPTSGVVQKRNAVQGKYFNEGANFFELSELSSVWIEMDVYEHDSGLISTGQPVSLTFSALPRVELNSEIDFINPLLNPKTRTLKIRATVKNPQGRLRPGMVADATIKIDFPGEPLVVPRSAVIDTGKRKVLWKSVGGMSFEAREVRTGVESDGYVEILSGIEEGDEVVMAGNFLLDAQAQLFGGYEDFTPPAQHQH